MNPSLVVIDAGPGVTLQDGGRRGYLRYGVTWAGPMDAVAFQTANLAVGNAANAAAIEVSVGGLLLTVEDVPLTVAVAGGNFTILYDGRSLPPATVLRLEPSATLSIRSGPWGAWCYLAIAGLLDVLPVLGSVSTHLRSGIGGHTGRCLAKGDRIPILAPRNPATTNAEIAAPWLADRTETYRVIMGPQNDYFAHDQIETFLSQDFILSERSDRMAYQLEGPTLTHSKGFNIVSDGIAMGAIQVTGEGVPLVLMADRQPTGGYPKIANLISADLGRFAQLRPGSRLRFVRVSTDEAVYLLCAQRQLLQAPIQSRPLVRNHFESEFLLGLNLIDGVTAEK